MSSMSHTAVVNCSSSWGARAYVLESLTGPNVRAMIAEICAVGSRGGIPETLDRGVLPMDALVQLFPGGDHPEMPVDALVSVPTVWEPKPSRVISDGSLLICKSLETKKMDDLHLPLRYGSGGQLR